MQKNNLQFNVIFRPEIEGGFTAIVPSLPGCVSYGKTIDEAQKMITDAISGYLTSLKKHKEPMPSSDEKNFISTIRVSKQNSLIYA
ncbi:MAG: type II toxin-antitoxin system HicB family antitoxin [bacterium]